MNYNRRGMKKMIRDLFVMLKSAKVEIKKEHQVLIVNKTTSFKKKGKGKKGTSRRMASKLPVPWRSPKLDPSLKLSASTTKEMVTGSGTAIFLEVPFLSLSLLFETSGLVNHQHLILFPYFYLHQFSVSRRAWESFPLSLAYYSSSRSSSNSVNHYLIWKINSHLIQAIVVPRQSEHMLTTWAILLHLLAIELVGDFISLNSGICLKY